MTPASILSVLAQAGRWTAHAGGALVLLLFAALLVADGPPRLSQLSWREIGIFICWFVLFGGLLTSWKWPAAGGAVAVAAGLAMGLFDVDLLRAWPVQAGIAAGVLHVVCAWAPPVETSRGAKIALAAVAAVALLLFANEMLMMPPLMTTSIEMPSPFAGTWRADDVEFTMASDGRVAGRIGTTPIGSARLSRNRSWFGRWIGWRSEYIVLGKMADGRTFTMPFNVDGAGLRGSVFLKTAAGSGPTRVMLRRSE
jgi:hypothetical protein